MRRCGGLAEGVFTAPVLLEMLIWGAQHNETDAPCGVILGIAKDRETVLAETRRRWEVRDPNPILPPFDGRDSHGPPGRNSRFRKKRAAAPLAAKL